MLVPCTHWTITKSSQTNRTSQKPYSNSTFFCFTFATVCCGDPVHSACFQDVDGPRQVSRGHIWWYASSISVPRARAYLVPKVKALVMSFQPFVNVDLGVFCLGAGILATISLASHSWYVPDGVDDPVYYGLREAEIEGRQMKIEDIELYYQEYWADGLKVSDLIPAPQSQSAGSADTNAWAHLWWNKHLLLLLLVGGFGLGSSLRNHRYQNIRFPRCRHRQ